MEDVAEVLPFGFIGNLGNGSLGLSSRAKAMSGERRGIGVKYSLVYFKILESCGHHEKGGRTGQQVVGVYGWPPRLAVPGFNERSFSIGQLVQL